MQRSFPSPSDKHVSLVQIAPANQKPDEPPFWTWFIENPSPAPKLRFLRVSLLKLPSPGDSQSRPLS